MTFPNSATASYGYDNARRLVALTNGTATATFDDHRYTLDAIGNRTAVRETLAQPGGPVPQAYGLNTSGQLGDNTLTQRPTPVAISAFGTPAALVAGGLHSLALLPDGTVKAWGENQDGQIGNNATTDQKTPLAVAGISAQAIGAGASHSLAVLQDGTVKAWGKNTNGQLGDGTTTTPRKLPVAVPGLAGVVAVSCGTAHSLALKSDGTVRAFGLRTNGRIGDGGSTSGNQTTPVQVSGLSGVIQIAAGGAHSLALKSDGTVWAWGANAAGQLGDNTILDKSTPVQVSGLTGVIQIAAGDNHSLAIKTDGTLWTWGKNLNGQLGDGTTVDKHSPTQVTALSAVAAIDGGASHSVAAKQDGTVWTWGLNTNGQLGDGTTAQKTTPVRSGTLALVAQVSAGTSHTLVGSPVFQTQRYSYDRLSRLTSENATTFAYDPVGNRTAAGATSFSYDRADRITAAGATAYTVDAAGNLVVRGADTFGYDQANRLKTATVAGTATTYAYDGDGVRVSRAQAAATTSYVHDRAGKLPVIIDDGTRRYLAGPAGLAYSLDAGGAATSYHQDALRSTRALSDATAGLVQRYQRDAWGTQTMTQGTSDQPFSFTGELRDQTTSFIHLRARDYDPAIGRFLQRDTVLGSPTVPISLHRYAYAADNPVTRRDPSGRWCGGVTFGGTASSGIFGLAGIAGATSVGIAICGGSTAGLNVGVLGNVGGFAGTPSASSATGGTGNVASGAFAGAGLSGFVSPQAVQTSDLGGAFRTNEFNAALGPVGVGLQDATGISPTGQNIEVFGLTPPLVSQGLGLSFTSMNTDTLTAPIWSASAGWFPEGGSAIGATDVGFADAGLATGSALDLTMIMP